MAHSDSGSSQRATGVSGKAFSLAAACLAAFAPASSWALFSDSVEIWAAENYTHDTNVLRLSKNINPAAVGAPTVHGDDIYTTHLGLTANVPVSLQQFTAELDWFRSRYKYFTDFDFTGHTARANWNWVVNPTFNGTLGASEAQGLASFANIQNREPDIIKTREAYATGNWMVTPRYRANAGVNYGETKHDDPLRQVNDIQLASGELGYSYVTPLDNSFGVVTRYEQGRLPHGTNLNNVPFDNAYKQWGVGAMTTWFATPKSRFDGRIDYVRRNYDQAPQRDYRGPMWKALYTWAPTPKLTVAAALVRDVGPSQDINTSFVLINGGYVRPRWNITEKITLQANAEYNVWDYRQDILTGQSVTHHVRTFGVSIAYRPAPKVLLSAGINREVRTSTLVTGDYEVTVGFIEGRVGF